MNKDLEKKGKRMQVGGTLRCRPQDHSKVENDNPPGEVVCSSKRMHAMGEMVNNAENIISRDRQLVLTIFAIDQSSLRKLPVTDLTKSGLQTEYSRVLACVFFGSHSTKLDPISYLSRFWRLSSEDWEWQWMISLRAASLTRMDFCK
ncbi:hypothetical protein POM88_032315 [Heracleum sosnowskyi]|uniref:Uncharacterized protein n=1 Tax=Heracleum sosnowskyi TaxID=360622 RepID=A0AAD8I127_9APIA|nr:hypothetical protein POM88_032315 [Heracleum sosnowskyi]